MDFMEHLVKPWKSKHIKQNDWRVDPDESYHAKGIKKRAQQNRIRKMWSPMTEFNGRTSQ